MSRRRLRAGEVGKISCTRQKSGKWRARCQYRDQAGVMRDSEVTADTKGEAEDLLAEKAHDLANIGVGDLTRDSTLADLTASWWETELDRHQSGKISDDTLAMYQRTMERITAGIGQLRIREAKTVRLQAWLKLESGDHYSVQRDLKRQLVKIFEHGMSIDATDRNPAGAISIISPPAREVEAYTADEVQLLRQIVRDYEQGVGKPEGKYRGGRPRAVYLADLVDLMLSTGCRISEILGLRWQDVDLLSDSPTITIVGIAKTRKADPAKGISYLYWQPKGKTKAAWRTIPLGEVAVEILLRLHVNNDDGNKYVFSTGRGTMRSPVNVRNALRKACTEAESTITGSKTHTLRKTVATLVEESEGVRAASLLLGHKHTSTTEKHYVKRAAVAPDVSGPLDALLTPPPAG